MPTQMLGKRVGVEKLSKTAKSNSFIAMPDDASAVGFVRYVGDEVENSKLVVGAKVYFGKNRHELKMDGVDILVMDEDNVYAIVNEDK